MNIKKIVTMTIIFTVLACSLVAIEINNVKAKVREEIENEKSVAATETVEVNKKENIDEVENAEKVEKAEAVNTENVVEQTSYQNIKGTTIGEKYSKNVRVIEIVFFVIAILYILSTVYQTLYR